MSVGAKWKYKVQQKRPAYTADEIIFTWFGGDLPMQKKKKVIDQRHLAGRRRTTVAAEKLKFWNPSWHFIIQAVISNCKYPITSSGLISIFSQQICIFSCFFYSAGGPKKGGVKQFYADQADKAELVIRSNTKNNVPDNCV